MLKRISVVLMAFSLAMVVFFHFNTAYAQAITLSEKKVIYDLPYAGILPDNPLYFLKEVRDTIMDFLTRDQMTKAENLLLSSDKKIHMAQLLAAKGKSGLMIKILVKAEQQSLRIPGLVLESKKQGVGPKEGLVYRLKLSNVKHREVVEELMKDIPQGQENEMNDVLDLNTQIKKQLDTL